MCMSHEYLKERQTNKNKESFAKTNFKMTRMKDEP